MSGFKSIFPASTEAARSQASPGVHPSTTFDQPLWQLAGTVESSQGPASEIQKEQALDEAQQTHALLAAIVESSDDAIISHDLNGVITSWNKGAERIFGYTAEEMIGKPTSELATTNSKEDSARVLQMIRNGERVDHYETTRRHKDGSDVYVSLSVSPICDAKGTIIGASKVSRDITRARLAEQALRNADKLALAGRMSASIAHEINNPLEAITNLLYLLRHESLSDEGRNYLDLAQNEIGRVSHIASETLSFFRSSPISAHCSVVDILESALALHAGKISTGRIELEREYERVMPLLCNPGELRQVVVNLIGNAIDAMPSGGRLRLRVTEACHPLTHAPGVRLSIADTGVGMAPATQRKIFEPFYTTKGATGTGLGLWVSNQLVVRHQGHISMRSSQGPGRHGTVFSVFLPRLKNLENDQQEHTGPRHDRQLPLPIDGQPVTSHADESRHTPAEPDSPSTAYNAA